MGVDVEMLLGKELMPSADILVGSGISRGRRHDSNSKASNMTQDQAHALTRKVEVMKAGGGKQGVVWQLILGLANVKERRSLPHGICRRPLWSIRNACLMLLATYFSSHNHSRQHHSGFFDLFSAREIIAGFRASILGLDVYTTVLAILIHPTLGSHLAEQKANQVQHAKTFHA